MINKYYKYLKFYKKNIYLSNDDEWFEEDFYDIVSTSGKNIYNFDYFKDIEILNIETVNKGISSVLHFKGDYIILDQFHIKEPIYEEHTKTKFLDIYNKIIDKNSVCYYKKSKNIIKNFINNITNKKEPSVGSRYLRENTIGSSCYLYFTGCYFYLRNTIPVEKSIKFNILSIKGKTVLDI